MNNLKCPFCLQKMNKSENNMFYCGTDNCSLRYIEMPKKAVEDFDESYQNRLNDCKRIGNLNEELIRTRKALEQSEICCTEWEKQALDYKAENIALSGKLDRTRKALDKAKWLDDK